ncbi:MAG: hypothetical protein KatS3mg105_4016 [Gemmatales bacterium]|nr:MAG: hypothetical protein KatS3mg105_4016 [Gemmatales bacterium]
MADQFQGIVSGATRDDHCNANDSDVPVRGWMLTCTEDCFAPRYLADKLRPGYWTIKRIEGYGLVPYGAGDLLLQEEIDNAIDCLGVRQLVVCGHWPCHHVAHLAVEANEWDRRVEFEATGRIAECMPGKQMRIYVEHHLCHQLVHLQTYPSVASALARGSLVLQAWLYDGIENEFFFPVQGPGTFRGRVALHPDYNTGLRSKVRRYPSSALPCLDPRDLYLA